MASSAASTNITNREALRDKIHEIHNFLRNNGAGYGMNALKVFNIFYGLKKIEHDGWLDRVDLKRPYCEFSFLLKLANENQGERLAELFLRDVLDSIYKSKLKDFLFYEIPRNLKGSVFVQLLKEIESLVQIEETCNVLLSGKIYEYFIGRDRTAISELGAYFTDRHIVDYILNKVNPSITADGTIPTMVDMFGGSGGFTTGYINFLKEKYPRTINWSTQLSKVHHYDMNEDVIKSAALEFFCLTGVLPDMSNMCYKNSFVDEFSNRKFKLVLTNPPYGGDKASKTDSQLKQDKVKEYIKQTLPSLMDEEVIAQRQKQLREIEQQEKLQKAAATKAKVLVGSCSARIQRFAHLQELTGNDKESCSLMLMMDIIDAGGTAVGVLKEGVFFDKKYKDLRKCLVENFNVREVISVPQDQFENTSTKTSILIFDNTVEKTTEVIFRDLIVEKYANDAFGVDSNNQVVLLENRGDIRDLVDEVVSVASREEILSNSGCSLNAKDYSKKPVSTTNPDFELVQFDNICEILPKSDRPASFGVSEGRFNFYRSSDIIQKCDIADFNEEYLIIGSGGSANIALDCNFSCSSHCFVVKTAHPKYLFFLLQGNMELLSNGFTGSTIKNLSKTYLSSLQIHIPKSPAKMQEWIAHISQPYDEKNAKQLRIDQLENSVKTKIRNVTNFDEVELETLCEYIKKGKNISSQNRDGTLYPYYGTTSITGYTDEYLFEGDHILLAQNGAVGKCFLVTGKFYPGYNTFAIKNSSELSIQLLFYLIQIASVEIQNCSNGSILQTISKITLAKTKMKIPRDKHFLEELEKTFQEISTLKSDVVKANERYQQRLDELAQEVNPTHKRKRTT
jgi:type I restriction-modification system DNA methylase subunit